MAREGDSGAIMAVATVAGGIIAGPRWPWRRTDWEGSCRCRNLQYGAESRAPDSKASGRAGAPVSALGSDGDRPAVVNCASDSSNYVPSASILRVGVRRCHGTGALH